MMFSRPSIEPLADVPIAALHDFLIRRGWVQKPSPTARYRYYEHSVMFTADGERMGSYLPVTEKTTDYPQRVHEFVLNQAQFWDLSPEAVYAELTGGPLAEPVRTSVPA